jgi:hypothetical protein
MDELIYLMSLDMVRIALFASFCLLSAFWAMSVLKG